MSRKLSTLTRAERAARLDSAELLTLCRDAARSAVRTPYTADDRAECVAHLYSYVMEAVAADLESRPRHGRPADVLDYIDRVLSSETVRQSAAMPMRRDARFTFTALWRRAHDWRRALETQRDYDALMSGKDDGRDDHPDKDKLPAEYLAAGAAQHAELGSDAAREACHVLGLPAVRESGEFCLLYQWARDVTGEVAAAELSCSWGAFKVRTHRAAERIRAAYTLPELVAALMGSPVEHSADGWRFSLRDDSREAHGRTPVMAVPAEGVHHWRTGTDGGDWPMRAEDAATADAACTVTRTRPAPKSAEQRRTRAAHGRTPEQVHAQALGRLGAALYAAAQPTSGVQARRTA